MPAAVDQCPQGHDTSTSTARDGQGHCRRCMAYRAKRKRVSDSMKLAMVRAFETAGVKFVDDDDQPVELVDVVRQLAATFEAAL